MKKYLITTCAIFLYFFCFNAQADPIKDCNDCFEIRTYDDNIFICKSREKYIKYILQCKKIASQAFKPPQNGEFTNWESVDIRIALKDCEDEAKEIFCKRKNIKK